MQHFEIIPSKKLDHTIRRWSASASLAILLSLMLSVRGDAAVRQKRPPQRQPTVAAQPHETMLVSPELIKKMDEQESQLRDLNSKLDSVEHSLKEISAEIRQQEILHVVSEVLKMLFFGAGTAAFGAFVYRSLR